MREMLVNMVLGLFIEQKMKHGSRKDETWLSLNGISWYWTEIVRSVLYKRLLDMLKDRENPLSL